MQTRAFPFAFRDINRGYYERETLNLILWRNLIMKHIYKEIANGLEFGMLIAMSIYWFVMAISLFIDIEIAKGLMLEGVLLSLAVPLNVLLVSSLEMKANEEE